MDIQEKNRLRDAVLNRILQAIEDDEELINIEMAEEPQRNYYTGYNNVPVKFRFNKNIFTLDISVEDIDKVIENDKLNDYELNKLIRDTKRKIIDTAEGQPQEKIGF